MNEYKKLCKQLHLGEHLSHQLKIALTHYSFTENDKNGSRYVFLGQTEFKGKVARVLFEFVQGKGTQLQHYLGNLFKTKYLNSLFSQYNLARLIRYGENFNVDAHKHIFTYAFLGFLSDQMETSQLNTFIYHHFIKNTAHLLPSEQANQKDYKSKVIFLCKLHYNSKPKLNVDKENDIYTFSLQMNKNDLVTAQSKSYKYAQKKIWKIALRQIAEKEEQKLFKDPEFVAREQEREKKQKAKAQRERAEKIRLYFEKRAQRSKELKKKKAAKKAEALQKDIKRRQAKIRAKERKELMEKQQRLKDMGLQNISASKRRILEDRGILPKKK